MKKAPVIVIVPHPSNAFITSRSTISFISFVSIGCSPMNCLRGITVLRLRPAVFVPSLCALL